MIYLLSKVATDGFLGLHKGRNVQATEEAFSTQKRTYSTSKHEISKIFSIFVGHFYPPEFEFGFNPDPDLLT